MNLLGPGGLVIFGVACLGMMTLVVGLNGWLKWRASQSDRYDLDPNSIEAAPAYRHFITVAGWSSGSGRNWDSSVRPVVSDLVESAAFRNRSSREDVLAALNTALGPDLSSACDRNGRCTDTTSKGPGRQALRKILEELDSGGRQA